MRKMFRKLTCAFNESGAPFNQQVATSLSSDYEHLVLVCGHYEGFDERIRDYVDGERFYGDYVLTGGD